MGVTPAGVSVRALRSRWGSCNKQGQLVERHCPAYARHRTWPKAKALELL